MGPHRRLPQGASRLIRDVRPSLHRFAADEGIPNSPLPLVVWKGRLAGPDVTGEGICALYERNGWTGTWIYTVYPFWHFHTKGHEVLTCVAGSATIGFGGEGGIRAEVEVGDVCVVPAGVGHRRFEASAGFLMAGGYPPGQSGDIVRPGDMSLEEAQRPIAEIELPGSDPVTGSRNGDLVALWG